MAGELDAAHREQLHEVAEVQARRRRVEPAVERDRLAREQLLQLRRVGRDVHEAAPEELLPDVVEGRDRSAGGTGTDYQRARPLPGRRRASTLTRHDPTPLAPALRPRRDRTGFRDARPGVAAPAQAGVDDFTFESLDVQYYLDRDDAGHSTLRTVETFVAVFPDFDQNSGLVRNIPITYGGTDAFDPRRSTPAAHRSVTDENGDPVYWETYDAGSGIYGMYIDDDTFKHGRTTYVIEYTQQNVTRHFDDTGADEFYWDVNGTGLAAAVRQRSSATVHLGDGLAGALNGDAACYRGDVRARRPPARSRSTATPSRFERDRGRQLPERLVRDRLRAGRSRPADDRASIPIVGSCPGCCSACSACSWWSSSSCAATRLGATRPAAASSCRSTRGPRASGVMPAPPSSAHRATAASRAVRRTSRCRASPGWSRTPRSRGDKRYRLELLDRDRGRGRTTTSPCAKLFLAWHAAARRSCSTSTNRKLGDRIAALVAQARNNVPKQRGSGRKKYRQLAGLLRWPRLRLLRRRPGSSASGRTTTTAAARC